MKAASECSYERKPSLGKHKHIWMYSAFCDICNADFDTWLREVKEEVARNLVIEDFNRMLCRMSIDEGKIDRKVLLEIHRNMRKLARARGYLRFPYEQDGSEEAYEEIGEKETF